MIESGDSTDDEGKETTKRPPPPSWSLTRSRMPYIIAQSNISSKVIDTFFSVEPRQVDLREIFPTIDDKHLRRNSSAVWNTPPRYSLMPKYWNSGSRKYNLIFFSSYVLLQLQFQFNISFSYYYIHTILTISIWFLSTLLAHLFASYSVSFACIDSADCIMRENEIHKSNYFINIYFDIEHGLKCDTALQHFQTKQRAQFDRNIKYISRWAQLQRVFGN